MSYGLRYVPAFSQALKDNIERTYTYSYAKNALNYIGEPSGYSPYVAFEDVLTREPFEAFMALERHNYKATLNALNRYHVPYTSEQERKARIKHEVIEEMCKERSDTVFLYIDQHDLEGTGIINIGKQGTYELTTAETILVSNFINKLNTNHLTSNVFYKEKVKQQLSKAQEKVVKGCLTHKYSCLIGGAGTGKSHVTSAIVDQLKANDKSVAILAPTHKAREALQSKLTEGAGDVRTIHSYVHSNTGHDVDAVIVDEAGMISTPLMLMLIRAYKSGQQLIFVGDKNQLEPIEYGRPFELLMKRLKVYELTENWRSESGDIISLGQELLGRTVNKNIEMKNIQVVDSITEAFEQGAEVLLTFTNANVALANEQQKLKDAPKTIAEGFSVGDKIIAKTNKAPQFFNGQLFVITSYDTAKNIATEEEIKFKTWQDLKFNFDLAYGLTIHKSQGSEWGAVAYMPSEWDTQNLAYVAVTRAKEKLIIVGSIPDSSTLRPPKEWRHY